jgi:hypothetical protein
MLKAIFMHHYCQITFSLFVVTLYFMWWSLIPTHMSIVISQILGFSLHQFYMVAISFKLSLFPQLKKLY